MWVVILAQGWGSDRGEGGFPDVGGESSSVRGISENDS